MKIKCDRCETPTSMRRIEGIKFWLCPEDNEGRVELPDGTHYLGWTRGEEKTITLWNNCPGCDSPVCYAPPTVSQVCSICLECLTCCECFA